MRAVRRLAGQIAAVEACSRGDAIGIGSGCIQGPRASHAIADRADLSGGTVTGKRVDEGACIGLCHGLRGGPDHIADRACGPFVRECSPGVERPVSAEAVEKIRHQDCITIATQTLGHLVQRRPRAESIHVEDDTRRRCLVPGLEKSRMGDPIRCSDFDCPFRHRLLLAAMLRTRLRNYSSSSAARVSAAETHSFWSRSEKALRQTSLWMMLATLARPLSGSLQVKASGMDSLR